MYALSDIVVSASIQEETFGRVAVEGQASGKIVIATNIGGSLETIIDNKTGFLIHPDDPYALADKIRECLHSHCDFSKKNYQTIINQSKKFDISIFEKNIIKFYNSL
jgi:glycosyltransferase involved in cell wall biosynthesis